MKLYTLSNKNIKKIKPTDVTISIFGLGKMGLPLAVVLADAGFEVIGTDINKDTVAKINKGINPIQGEKHLSKMLSEVVKKKKLKATTDGIQAAKNSDVKIILVPILVDSKNKPDLTILHDVVEKIAKGLKKGDIVILESTAPPGTTLNVIGKKIEQLSGLKLNEDFGVAHCPERVSSGTAIADIQGRLCPKVVGGSDAKTTDIAQLIYNKINKRATITVANPTAAEMVKLSGEIYRDVNIAYANNLYLQCKELGIDAAEVIKASNTNPYSHILTPSPGVGGHCIPVYPYFVLNATHSQQALLKTVRQINDAMPEHVVQLTNEVLSEKNVKIKNANVLILGIAYRAGVKELRRSPGLEIAQLLKSQAEEVFIMDPLFTKEEISKLGFSSQDNFKNIDSIIITIDEDTFRKLQWDNIGKQMRTKTLVDTKGIINFTKLSGLGFVIRRIGYAK